MTQEMRCDAVLFFQTLFGQNLPGHPYVQLSHEEAAFHDQRVLFLKRLLLCYAVCGLRYCSDDNSAITRSFPYPLASAFGHGGRVLLRLDGVNWRTLLALLLWGEEHTGQLDESHMPAPFYVRRAATHGIRFDQRNAHLLETRLHHLSAI